MSARILTSIGLLHAALYDRLSTITSISNLQFLGFDDGKSRPSLQQIGMQISCTGMDTDRGRVMPQVIEPSGATETITYDGEDQEVQTSFTVKQPIAVDLTYEVDCWCYDSQTSLAMDVELMKLFPERGVLTLPIAGEDTDFPIELLGIQNLDDLTKNIREKIYRYKIEAWIPGFLADRDGKIITSITNEIYRQTNDNADAPEGYHLQDAVTAPDA